jgi:hypothetical protein
MFDRSPSAEKVQAELRYPRCRVTIHNSTPSDWHASIVEVACRFFYKKPDGSIVDEIRSSARVHVSSGGNVEVDGTMEFCCKAVKTLTVMFLEGQDVPLEVNDPGETNKCLTAISHNVAPANMVDEYVGAANRAALLVLT